MSEHELWSFQNAFLFILLVVLALITTMLGSRALFDIKRIKEDWPNQRCTPLIMPFAGIFGYNTKENFEFCMGKIFTTHSQGHLGSMGSIFTKFTGLLQSIFQSVNSLRNTISSLGGGINVIFQEFTERISMFFFRLRLSSIHLKSLFMRMYALLFSVMYMGMSGVTGMTSFTNTFLFSFLDTFCFPGDTLLQVQRGDALLSLPIREVVLGDVLSAGAHRVTAHRVTACFQFEARGQPMVRLGTTIVSTNHYVAYKGAFIKAGQHPDAVSAGVWTSEDPLYCLNTDTHHIPIGPHLFMDYDETPAGDVETMRMVEHRVNGTRETDSLPTYPFTEYGAAVAPTTRIQTDRGCIPAHEIQRGDRLSTGSVVVGVIRKRVREYGVSSSGITATPSTLVWSPNDARWIRWGTLPTSQWTTVKTDEEKEMCSFIVVPNSQLECEDGTRIRDYLEWCSPDTEAVYSQHIENVPFSQ